MESVYKKFKDGEISRKEVYEKAAEILCLPPEKIEFVYKEYFKPSQEECFENITPSCDSGNYLLQEEQKFEEFIFFIAKNDQEKIREIKALAQTE